jgi:hypothetical protein
MSKVILRKYGEAATFNFDLFEIDGIDFKIDAVHVAGDTKIMKDEGVEANTTNGFTDEGQGYSIVLTATEMEHARGKVYIVDQGTKAWLDTGITIETYGHASAQHPYMNEGVWDRVLTGATHNVAGSAGRRLRSVGDVVSGSVNDAAATTISFITDLTGTYTDHYADQTLHFTSGNLIGISRSVLSYNEITKLLTIEEPLPVAPANGDDFDLNPVHVHPVSQIVDEVWDEVLTSGTHNVANSSGKRLRDLKEQTGYEGGFIYIDTVGGAAGSDPYVNGTLDNPVNNMTDLNTLAASLNIFNFKVAAGSSITFTASQEKENFIGNSWTLALGGQSISGSYIEGAAVSGICTGVIAPIFNNCEINGTTMPPSHFDGCGFNGTMVVGSAGTFYFALDSHSSVAGTGTPIFDYGAAVGVTNFNFRGYHGGIKLLNMLTGDNFSHDGDGQIIIDASCTGGTMRISGHQTVTGADAFETAGGTISDDARFATDQLTGVGTTYLADVIVAEKIDTLLDINKSLDFTVNTTTRLEYQWLDTDGDPVNITGLTFKFKAVKNAGEASPAIAEVTGTISDGPNGRWYFDVLPTTVFKGRYEIWSVDGTPTTTTLTKAGGARIETHPRL